MFTTMESPYPLWSIEPVRFCKRYLFRWDSVCSPPVLFQLFWIILEPLWNNKLLDGNWLRFHALLEKVNIYLPHSCAPLVFFFFFFFCFFAGGGDGDGVGLFVLFFFFLGGGDASRALFFFTCCFNSWSCCCNW